MNETQKREDISFDEAFLIRQFLQIFEKNKYELRFAEDRWFIHTSGKDFKDIRTCLTSIFKDESRHINKQLMTLDSNAYDVAVGVSEIIGIKFQSLYHSVKKEIESILERHNAYLTDTYENSRKVHGLEMSESTCCVTFCYDESGDNELTVRLFSYITDGKLITTDSVVDSNERYKCTELYVLISEILQEIEKQLNIFNENRDSN